MNYNYITQALIAMVLISLTPALAKFATQGMSPRQFLTVATVVMLLIYGAVAVVSGENILKPFNLSKYSLVAYAAGFVFAAAMLLYYKAIASGPISVVVPIWSLQIVAGSIIGMGIYKEIFTVSKLLGIVMALMSIWFLTRSD